MSRLLRIAIREYLAYVRTPGFWLSVLLLPLGISAYAFAPTIIERSSPPAELTVADFTGRDLSRDIAAGLGPAEPGGPPLARLVSAPGAPFARPAQATARLEPYLVGERRTADGGRLEAAAILRPNGKTVAIDFWSRNIADRSLERAVTAAVGDALRRERLEAVGVAPGALAEIDALAPQVADFSPKAADGKIALKDRLPGIVGFAMGLMLWMVILTGAGMLLNSVIEEKSSRILEVLLSSASVPEIIGGKIAGVAAVTATVLSVWLTIAGVALAARFPEAAGDLAVLLFAKGLAVYFALYFLGGYLMFATLYVTIGAFCESVREAQTLMGPVMIVMSVPMVFMSQALTAPDAPLLRTLEWIPPFTPFMMAARAASDPPVWEIAATLALIFAVTAAELWLAVPAFKSGALASGRFDLRRFLATLAGRRAV
ncbi:MAG: ABC transporter permease [Caulobacteraceae bacterium]